MFWGAVVRLGAEIGNARLSFVNPHWRGFVEGVLVKNVPCHTEPMESTLRRPVADRRPLASRL